MRSVILLLCVLMAGCATATIEELTVTNIVDVGNMKKDAAFDKTLDWMASTFGSSKSVIEQKDKERGKIIGNIITDCVSMGFAFPIKSSMTIDVKDNRVRFVFVPHQMIIQGSPRSIWSNEVGCARDSFKPLLTRYKTFMTTAKKEDKDW